MSRKLDIYEHKRYTYNELASMGKTAHDIEELDFVLTPEVPLPRSQHPLLNPESKHYEMIGGVQAIELMEAMFTVDELKAWAKLTAMKYRLRIGDKDAPEKEIAKIKTFEAYWRYLDARK